MSKTFGLGFMGLILFCLFVIFMMTGFGGGNNTNIPSGLTNTTTIFYNQSGTYQLDNTTYGNTQFLLVEMWGAGGGGCGSIPNDCRNGAGGGGGAYVLALVGTNSFGFNITVGKGGKGMYPTESYELLGMDNAFTSFVSLDPNQTVMLVVGGGARAVYPTYIGYGGKLMEMFGADIISGANGTDGSVGYFTGETGTVPHGGRGGNSTLAMGGDGSSANSIHGYPGNSPGGGGGGSMNNCPEYCFFGVGGDGADGMVKITFVDYNNGMVSDGPISDGRKIGLEILFPISFLVLLF